MTDKLNLIIPNWPAPANVNALQTNRYAAAGDGVKNGFSVAPYDSFNLGSHVKDNPIHVAQNRQLLSQFVPSAPVWLNQTHSINVVDAAKTAGAPDADASFSTKKNVVCVIMTADCLPVLLCDKAGTIVIAVHAGWRGLCDDALEASIHEACRAVTNSAAQIKPSDLMAWFGPAIGPNAFEVGVEVRAQFIAKDAKAKAAFKANGDKWLCNIYQIAAQRLNNVGVTQIYGGGQNENWCTFTDKDQFFSYRRDGVTGRMATLIWLA